MDDIDRRILQILSSNARATVSEISGQVNLSVPAVSERLRKLESSGVIEKYTAILNSEAFGRNLTAIMLVSIKRTQSVGDFLNTVQNSKDVLECHYIAGDYDYMLKIITENASTLEALLNKIKGIAGVQKTNTVLVLSTLKSNPSILP